jgi:probable phosphoglycerate mutase
MAREIFASKLRNPGKGRVDRRPDMREIELFYIRHGQTDWNAEQRFQGRRDIPLNATGRAQAEANGRKLASMLADPDAFDFIASPLWRARETMEILRQAMGLAPSGYRIDERLIEASYGLLEGTTLAEFKRDDPQMHRARRRERWDFRPEEGESHAMVHARIAAWHASLRRNSVVVAHGVIGRVLRHHLYGVERQAAADFAFPQDRIFHWSVKGERLV